MPKGPDDILPRPTLDDLTPDDLALLEGSGLPGFSPHGDAVTIACGPLCVWWGAVLVLSHAWAVGEQTGAMAHLWNAEVMTAGLGAAGSLPLVYRMGRGGVWRRWWTQALPVTALTAAAGSLILLFGDTSGMALCVVALCVVAAILFAVMATVGRIAWLMIPAVGWLAAGMASLCVAAGLPYHVLMGSAAVLFLVLPGIKLWRQALRQSAMRQFGLL